MKRKLLILTAILVSLLVALPVIASASPAHPDDPFYAPQTDFRMDPLTKVQTEQKATAMDAVLNGKAFGKVHEVAKGQFVELAREGEDPVWTVLGEFGDFSHNSIAEPNREVNNTTLWVEASTQCASSTSRTPPTATQSMAM